jgi:hypothetical protein
MTLLQSVSLPAQATFGRDGALFEGLLGFVSQLSVVLWGLVLLTVVVRFVGIGLYRRGARRRAARMALVQAVPPSDPAPAAASTTTATAEVVRPVTVQVPPALASNSTEPPAWTSPS